MCCNRRQDRLVGAKVSKACKRRHIHICSVVCIGICATAHRPHSSKKAEDVQINSSTLSACCMQRHTLTNQVTSCQSSVDRFTSASPKHCMREFAKLLTTQILADIPVLRTTRVRDIPIEGSTAVLQANNEKQQITILLSPLSRTSWLLSPGACLTNNKICFTHC